MQKVIACVDGSSHFYSVCDLSSWINNVTNADISLLHVVAPHYNSVSRVNFSGSIGFGAKTKLLNDLTDMGEMHGKMQQSKGESILSHAMNELKVSSPADIQKLHLRGSLSEVMLDVSAKVDIIVMGRGGDGSTLGAKNKIGSNLQSVIRTINKPIMVASMIYKPIETMLIAYDGTEKSLAMINYVANSKLLKDLHCHLVFVGKKTDANKRRLNKASAILSEAVPNLQSLILDQTNNVQDAISEYLEEKYIDLLIMGAYNSSRLRSFIAGSKTSALINKINVPILLLR